MPDDHGLVHDPWSAASVPREDRRGGEIEGDGDGPATSRCGTREQSSAGEAFDVRGVDDGQPPCRQSGGEGAMEAAEGRPRRALVRGVTRDRFTVAVRRQDLVRREVACRERGLPGTGRTDEDDEARIGQDDLRHPLMMAVGYCWRRTS